MKVGKWALVLSVATLVGVFFLFSGSAVQAKTIQLSYANFFPPTHIQAKLGKSWAEEIESRTNGEVKITYYPGGSLCKGPKMYDGILKGITDIGMSVLGYTAGVFPAMQAIDLPVGYPNGKVATQVINDFYEKFKPEELSKVKVMYFHAHGPGLLHTRKVAVRKLEDIKGLKIRCYGYNKALVKELGGVPVTMGQGDVYEALQKGVVDGTLSPMEVLKGWKQGEVVDYTTECKDVGYTAGFFVFMNLDKWNSLPEDVQAVFDEVSQEWISKHGEAWDEADKEGREFTLEQGNEIIQLSEEESDRWVEAAQPVINGYIKAKKEKGLPAEEYVEFLQKATAVE